MTQPPKPLSADRPLDDPRFDRLGYAAFAKQLAVSILKGSPSDGLVVALYGDWGTGKTSALKFIVHYLELQDDAPVIMWFNPWWFAGQEDLIRRFFKQFQVTVVKSKLLSKKANREKLARAIGVFGDALSHTPAIPGVPFIGEIGKAVGKGAKAVAAQLVPTDVVEMKEQISEALAAQNARIIVIIDDIDRLVAEEIRQLFQLIKAVADFPNVTYLLAFDRKVAAHAMNTAPGVGGAEYLEKIVQVPFALPPPERTQLQALLFERLDEVLDGTPDDLFDQSYWAGLYIAGIDRFIRKPRDIVRLTNALKVTYPAVRGEVHAVDFIGIEVIRVFAPDAYDLIRMNPSRFVYGDGRVERKDTDEERRFHEAWLAQVRPDDLDSVRSIVGKLFPRWASLFGNMGFADSFAKEWRRTLRICSAEVFPVYFRLAPPSGGVSAGEIRHLIGLATDASAFAARLTQLASETGPGGHTRVSIMLTRLQDHADVVPLDLVPNIIAALFDAGDDILAADKRERGFLDLGDDYRIGWVLRALLKRLPPEGRAPVLHAAIANGRALVTMVNEVSAFGHEHGRRGAEESSGDERMLPTVGEVEQLEEAVATRVVPAAASGDLWTTPRPHALLEAVRLWVDADEARKIVAERIVSDGALLAFLGGFKNRRHSHGLFGGAVSTSIRLDPMRLWAWLDVESVEHRLRAEVDPTLRTVEAGS